MRVNSTVGWEPRTRALLRRLLQQTTGTVFEAGAHVGDHLLPLAAAFPNLRFVGLDPDPSKVAFVERMVAANALANVRVITAALDAAPRDDCGLDRSDANAGAWRVGGNGTGACTTIDAVLASADDVGLVHLDLEGFEYRALLGGNATLGRAPNVLFENDHLDEGGRIYDHLDAMGFAKFDEVEHNELWRWASLVPDEEDDYR